MDTLLGLGLLIIGLSQSCADLMTNEGKRHLGAAFNAGFIPNTFYQRAAPESFDKRSAIAPYDPRENLAGEVDDQPEYGDDQVDDEDEDELESREAKRIHPALKHKPYASRGYYYSYYNPLTSKRHLGSLMRNYGPARSAFYESQHKLHLKRARENEIVKNVFSDSKFYNNYDGPGGNEIPSYNNYASRGASVPEWSYRSPSADRSLPPLVKMQRGKINEKQQNPFNKRRLPSDEDTGTIKEIQDMLSKEKDEKSDNKGEHAPSSGRQGYGSEIESNQVRLSELNAQLDELLGDHTRGDDNLAYIKRHLGAAMRLRGGSSSHRQRNSNADKRHIGSALKHWRSPDKRHPLGAALRWNSSQLS